MCGSVSVHEWKLRRFRGAEETALLTHAGFRVTVIQRAAALVDPVQQEVFLVSVFCETRDLAFSRREAHRGGGSLPGRRFDRGPTSSGGRSGRGALHLCP